MMQEQNRQFTCLTRELFNGLVESLPSIEFDKSWEDVQGALTKVPESINLFEPATSVNKETKQRIILIPTHRFGIIVLWDLWPHRQESSPLVASFPLGFDLIDSAFTGLSLSEDAVAERFATSKEITVGEALLPIFDRLLLDAKSRAGILVKFS